MAKLDEMVTRSVGQRALIEAKMKEFEGLLLIGNDRAADACREDVHSLVDAFFDSQAQFIAAAMKGELR